MGLDITYYMGIKKVGSADYYDEYEEEFDWSKTFFAHPGLVNDPSFFPGWAEGLDSGGVYEFESSMGFRAGSYGYYNQWRNMLSEIALGVSAHVVWSNVEKYKDEPFFRLINFSDCDGFIGPVHCQGLLQDFLDHEDAAIDAGGNFLINYRLWLDTLSVNDGDGVLRFH